MLALAGLPLGVRFRCYDPNPDAPAGEVAALTVGEFDDSEALARFAAGVDVVTYEFENVPVSAARSLALKVPVYPPPPALHHAQDRLFEKSLFETLKVPVTPFAAVDGRETLDAAVAKVGLPAILKTRRLGYDGKGQFVIKSAADVDDAWRALAGSPLILEKFIPFDRELSIIAVRGRDGGFAFYPMTENVHRRGILHTSRAPAGNVEKLQPLAESRARAIMESLEYVGVLAIEFFQAGEELLANEMAPRVHNSGHWTIEGAA
ncbi:MAG TPA: 5-(carboxyamino)imidazole ribonucleotide synthase, partial [Planctomycetia bacterium]|nr:5-(carboxyamino)imidazole ribonucleotide synthase [Planctomycetia bacterium]